MKILFYTECQMLKNNEPNQPVTEFTEARYDE